MSILLYVAGAIVIAIGAALIGFGIPINEFSFGNTLIIAGTVAMAGGLIVFALGVVVRQLQNVAEAYSRGTVRQMRPPEAEAILPMRASPPSVRAPFPPKPKGPLPRPDAVPREMVEAPADELRPDFGPPPFAATAPMPPPVRSSSAAHLSPRPEEEVFGAPALPNPDEAPVFAPPEPPAKKPAASEPLESRQPPLFPDRDADVPLPPLGGDRPERSYFDSMWPADSQPFEPSGHEPEPIPDAPVEPVSEPAEPETASAMPVEEAHPVPILKSGVVDGMGYTLYVDGSIEAELPQGTLRFASINELRAHLEKAS